MYHYSCKIKGYFYASNYIKSFKYDNLIFYKISKMKSYFCLIVVCLVLTTTKQQQHTGLELQKAHQIELKQRPFIGRYTFDITQQKVLTLKSKIWYFFVDVEPSQEKEWIQTQIEMSVGEKNSQNSKLINKCDAVKGGVDSCLLTSKQFNYKNQQVHVKIRCKGPCKFKLSADVQEPYELVPNAAIRMDFEDTAYSKLFTLDTSNKKNIEQLRIILKPEGFLEFPAPVSLFLNQDDTVPTKSRHDMKGMTLWDNGLGIFIDAPDCQGLFTILVEGPEKNILTLKVQIIEEQTSFSLQSNLPFFDYLGKQSTRKYKAPVDPEKGVCLQMTTFSGAIKLKNIYDQTEKKIKQQFPQLFRTYSEIEYQLSAQFFKKNKDTYEISKYVIFEIQGVKQSTFVLESFEISPQIFHLLPERVRYVEIPSKNYHQYYIQIVEQDSPQFKRSEFEFILTTQENKNLKTRFINCHKDHGKQCELKKSQLSSSKLDDSNLVEISPFSSQSLLHGVQINKFSISASKFLEVKDQKNIKKYILMLVIENPESDQLLYTLQYINYGKSIYLKEGEPKTDRVSIDQSKYYAFTNTNKDIKEVRVHIVEISGRVFMEGYLEDPRKKDLSGQALYDFHNSINFEEVKENDSFYIKITGKENAYYSIQLQLVKQDERNWWNRTHPGGDFNKIIIVEDIPYQFTIPPNSKQVYQIHSKTKEFMMDISSIIPVQVCMTETLTLPPFKPNCEQQDILTKNKIYDVKLEKGLIGNIGVSNTNDKDTKFSIKITGKDSVKPIDQESQKQLKCTLGVLGKITKYNFKKDTQSCYSYFLPDKLDDLEVVVDVISDQYEKVDAIVSINKIVQEQVIGAIRLFKKSQLQKACGQKKSNCPIKITIKSKVDTEIRFTAQLLSGTFFLLDGIANQFHETNNPRYFAYELYNKYNTTIVLHNKNGFSKFYGKVVEANNYWNGKQSMPTQKDNHISSNNPFYYLYQISILTEIQIKESKCTQCLLLISVVPDTQGFDNAEKKKFIIQCTQQERFLKQRQQVVAFLSHRSIAFYDYYNTQKGTIVVSTSSQNQQCSVIYMKKGLQERASASAFDKQSSRSNSNILIYENAEVGSYSIAVQATEDCHYAISVSKNQNSLRSIERGIYTDLSLDAEETVRFIYEHNTNQSLRILTLHQNGELTISAKAYKNTPELINDNISKVKYDWSGKDFLKIETTRTGFCSSCSYLISIQAQRNTKSSIMIPSKGSHFPIIMDATVKDELEKGEEELLRIFTDKLSQFEINVGFGSIKLQIVGAHDKQVQFQAIYNASKSTIFQNVSSTQKGGISPINDYMFMQYSEVKIQALTDSAFRFGFISNKDEQNRGSRVKYGVPEYISLAPKKRQCVRGTLTNSDQQFLISITGQKQEYEMENLEISCTVNGTLLQLTKQIAKDQMIVKIEKVASQLPANYEFCMQFKEDLFLTFIHSAQLNYFPKDKSILIRDSMNLSFYAEGKSLIEINQCTSRASTTISKSFNNLGQLNGDIRQVRKTNNIIEFTFYGPIYIHIQSKSATALWRPKDQLTRIGYGYDQYSTNKIRIDKLGESKMRVDVYPLKTLVSNPTVKLEYVRYIVVIAEEEMNLYEAMNCKNGVYLQQTMTTNFDEQEKKIVLFFDIDQILNKFKDKKYVLVGVIAFAKSTIEGDSNYRFIYPYQEVLMSTFRKDSGSLDIDKQPIDDKNQSSGGFSTFVLYFTFSVVLCFLLIWVYRKWLRAIVNRKRRERLSEQGTGEVRYQEFTSYT